MELLKIEIFWFFEKIDKIVKFIDSCECFEKNIKILNVQIKLYKKIFYNARWVHLCKIKQNMKPNKKQLRNLRH